MNGSDNSFTSFDTFGDILYTLRKHDEANPMNAQRAHSPLFLIIASLFLLMVLVGLAGCTAPVDEEAANMAARPAVVGDNVAAGPVETTEAFYNWYFDYIGDPGSDSFRNPLADRAYGDSQYLSARLIQEVDDLKNEYGSFPYDPFLQAQDFPLETTVEAWEEGEDSARVIVHQQWGENVRDLTVDLVREDGRWLIDAIARGNPTTPEGTTELFYRWYLAYIGDRSSGTFNNPLVDRAYRDSEYLSDNFIQKVDEILASAEGGGYDPILLAQDIPVAINVTGVEMMGDTASVAVERFWGGNPTPSPMTVSLVEADDRWLIAGVTMDGQAPAMLPAEVVDAFYAQWRLAIIGDMRNSEGSPLTEGAYRNSGFLTDDFKSRVDALVAGMEKGGFDPFLCAQDVPNEITPVSTFMGPQAQVLVTTDFSNHAFTVVLELHGAASWQIDDVICANTPVGATTAFYSWYLGYPGDPAASTGRNPLAGNAYRDAPFLSDALVAETDALLEEMRKTPAGYDPFLQAQDYATAFAVYPTEQADRVLVDLFFGNPAGGAGQTLLVGLVEEQGQWLIRSIEPGTPAAETGANRDALDRALATLAAQPVVPDGETIVNDDYGFSFQVPAGWVAEPMQMDGPGMPDDWPVEAGYLLMPAALAEEMAGRSGPPAPDDPPLIPPFSVEVVIGDRAAFDRAFIPAFASEETELGGTPLTVEQDSNGDAVLRYIFRNARDTVQGSARWIVFNDVVGGFSAREALAADVAGILPGILSTFAFAE